MLFGGEDLVLSADLRFMAEPARLDDLALTPHYAGTEAGPAGAWVAVLYDEHTAWAHHGRRSGPGCQRGWPAWASRRGHGGRR